MTNVNAGHTGGFSWSIARGERPRVLALLTLVLLVRVAYAVAFGQQSFSGPSTIYDQAFVAIGLQEGKGITTYARPPASASIDQPNTLTSPATFPGSDADRVAYTKEVPGYAGLLASLWTLAGTRSWLLPIGLQIVLDVLAGLGLYLVTRSFFGVRAACATLLVFAFMIHEARICIVPYKDIFAFYFMVAFGIVSAQLWFAERLRAGPVFAIGVLTGSAYYFMPNMVLYPFALFLALGLARRIAVLPRLVGLAASLLIAGVIVMPHRSFVSSQAHESNVAQPLFWYRLWLATKIDNFASAGEDRFPTVLALQDRNTSPTIEDVTRRMFMDTVRAKPGWYVLHTLKKLSYGTLTVYANAGDARPKASVGHYKETHPGASILAFLRDNPERGAGMLLGTAVASCLFPLAMVGLFMLRKRGLAPQALFFMHFPLYLILFHMPFHYEARYLLGVLVGYLPILGAWFAYAWESRAERALTLRPRRLALDLCTSSIANGSSIPNMNLKSEPTHAR